MPRKHPKVRWEEMLPWYQGYYVSDDGRIVGRRGEELSPQVNERGHIRVAVLDPNGRHKMIRVARIVCWHFNGPFPADGIRYQAVHIDHNRANNNYWNLEWQKPEVVAANRRITWTQPEAEVRSMLGLYTRNASEVRANGQNNHNKIFSPDKLRTIQEMSGLGVRELANATGVSAKTVSDWMNGVKVPRPRNLQALTDALGIELADVLDLE
jgi:DNA-binding transcriptional regulator YiaG